MRIESSRDWSASAGPRPARRTLAPTAATAPDAPPESMAQAEIDAAKAASEPTDVQEAREKQPKVAGPKPPGKTELTSDEEAVVAELRRRDAEVRAHEAAHAGAAGSLGGGATYDFQTGPDGRSYAVGGEVSVQMDSGGTPEEALRNAAQVRAAALAPAEPSGQDRAVASQAAAIEAAARAQIAARNTSPKAERTGEATPGERPPRTEAPKDEDGDGRPDPVSASESSESKRPRPEDLIQQLEGEQMASRAGWRHLHLKTGCGGCGQAISRYS